MQVLYLHYLFGGLPIDFTCVYFRHSRRFLRLHLTVTYLYFHDRLLSLTILIGQSLKWAVLCGQMSRLFARVVAGSRPTLVHPIILMVARSPIEVLGELCLHISFATLQFVDLCLKHFHLLSLFSSLHLRFLQLIQQLVKANFKLLIFHLEFLLPS